MSTWYVIPSDNDLMHHGVKGMKWGVRNDPQPKGGTHWVSTGRKPTTNRKSGYGYSSNYSKVSNSAYQSNKKKGTPSSIKKTGDTARNSAPLNSLGAAALAGGCTPDEMREFEDIYARLLSGEIDYNTISEKEIDLIAKVMTKLNSMGKNVYNQFSNRVKKDPAAYDVLREIGYGVGTPISPGNIGKIGKSRK